MVGAGGQRPVRLFRRADDWPRIFMSSNLARYVGIFFLASD